MGDIGLFRLDLYVNIDIYYSGIVVHCFKCFIECFKAVFTQHIGVSINVVIFDH